jgi:anthraniloyl-CoA monooxygenase
VNVVVIGGGPAGLYFSILFKKARPDARIRVYERNPADVTWGWGVVFSDETLGNFEEADPETHAAIQANFIRWGAITTHLKGRTIVSGGHGFCGIRRMKLLRIMQARAAELGVELHFEANVEDPALLTGADLVVAADGINSATRDRHAEVIRPQLTPGKSRFIWLGTTKLFDTFTFVFKRNDAGLFQVHAYRFDAEHSTFIVECSEETWKNAGLDTASEDESLRYCERLFADELGGHSLLANKATWINFRHLVCERWYDGNVVFIGDAAHTAHFSIGSGTKLAMEDAIVLSGAVADHGADVAAGLAAYEERRRLDVAKLQRAAQVSQRWFEESERYFELEPERLVASMMTRSKRITHGNLRVRDPEYVRELDVFHARSQGWSGDTATDAVPPPMFLPLTLRSVTLENRVVISPMCMYSAEDGLVNEWHLVHLGSRAIGGAGLVFTEMTMVSPEGRISPGCAGLWSDAHRDAWAKIVDFVHANSRAKLGMQIGHAGRKAATKRSWEGDNKPLTEGAWPIVAPSPLPWSDAHQVPRALDRDGLREVRAQFVRAARYAGEAGFDVLELHGAHGYLLSTFLSPLTNLRKDEYGGDLQGRLRFPLEVFDAVRDVWPSDKPLFVRISATDWAEGGTSEEDAVAIGAAFAAHGADVIDVSAGSVVPYGKPVYGRMFQTPFSDRIRNDAGIKTMAVGNIQDWDQINTILVTGRADLCALARPHLWDCDFTRHAAAAQDYRPGIVLPKQYRAAISVLGR